MCGQKSKYSTNCTRPDLAHTLHVMGHYTSSPGHKHLKAIMRVELLMIYQKLWVKPL